MTATGDITVLQRICRGAEMGEATITRLLPRTRSAAFRRTLNEQLRDYRSILTRARRLAREEQTKIRGLSPAMRHCAAAMIRTKPAIDPSASHMAAMMMQGSNMGIIDITRRLNHMPQTSPSVRKLANNLLKIERQNLENMKRYL